MFDDPNDPEQEYIAEKIADCLDELIAEGLDDIKVWSAALSYVTTMCYLMATVESVDGDLESIRERALQVKERQEHGGVDPVLN